MYEKEWKNMNWLNKLERKFGKYAIPNLMVWVLGAYGIGFILNLMAQQNPQGIQALDFLSFHPYYILKGQIWRLVTWIFQPSTTSIFSMFFMFMLYYQLGGALERAWGTFRFNVYIIGGILFTTIGCLLFYVIISMIFGEQFAFVTSANLSALVSTDYINMSIFLAFAVMYPNLELYLYFILPVKMKWMSVFYGVLIVYRIYQYASVYSIWIAIIAAVVATMSLLNFLIFFLSSKDVKRYSPKEVKRRQDFKRQMAEPRPGSGITRHKCAVCGRTEVSNPELEFRYCSKCEGNFEYCQDHLFTHQHVHRS